MDDEDVFLDEEMGEIEITTKPKEDISDFPMKIISFGVVNIGILCNHIYFPNVSSENIE